MYYCKFLYHETMLNEGDHDIPIHSHSFWQLEYIVSNEIILYLNNEKKIIKPPCLIFIPPHVKHGFSYPSDHISLYSLKFKITGGNKSSQLLITSPSAETQPFCKILENETLGKKAVDANRIEEILLPLWKRYFVSPHQKNQSIQNLNQEIRNYVDSLRGKRIAVSELAGFFSYSPGHLSRYFRSQNNQSLKKYIDIKCADYAKEALLYSDKSISEIAAQLDFQDLFSFSQFFKRHTGVNPSQFKEKNK
jgi:AraC-like DNA-binding protein